MGFFNYIKKCLSPSQCKEDGQLLHKEQLNRSDCYLIQYEKWRKTSRAQDILANIHSALEQRIAQTGAKDNAICFFMIPTINGFTLQFRANRWNQEDFIYFVEYLKRALQQKAGFDSCDSTHEKVKQQHYTEFVERHSLKNNTPDSPYQQILLRLCSTHNKIKSIKLCATCRSGQSPNFSHFLKSLID